MKKEQLVAPRRRVKGGGWTGPVEGASEQERERELVGSLTSTYKFKPDGLIKKVSPIFARLDRGLGRVASRSDSSFPRSMALPLSPFPSDNLRVN